MPRFDYIKLKQFFVELIQVAIGQRRCLSKVLTGEEWGLMYGLFKKHGKYSVTRVLPIS